MPAPRSSSRSRASGASSRDSTAALPWHQAVPGPVVLVTGPEQLLAERAVERIRDACRERSPELEVVAVEAAAYRSGELTQWTSPSLFEEARLVVVNGLEAAPDVLVTDVSAALGGLPDDVVLVLRHSGGARAGALLKAARVVPGAVLVECPAVKSPAEQRAFAQTELRSHGRTIDDDALDALLLAIGSDLRSLAAACSQLATDVPRGTAAGGRAARLTADDVERYYGGRAEVTGFKVADAAVAGQRAEALRLLRQALESGLDPVPLVAALALKLRGMAKVASAGRGSPDVLAKSLGMAPWQVRTTRDSLRGWTPDGIAAGITALAEADEAVKGGGRDPRYAVEKAVIAITAARAG
ncbi:DNA polymerase III subunit delta [Quadrisphaera granulorum]|uniref:DNA polymerase III subunit delta n=1 Tax=Quadrisphaera granulorum TaxID=317664 RepID=UPI000D6C60AB|nr:DNA polymerase III subunit delta [Quadrisphaera granulorum]